MWIWVLRNWLNKNPAPTELVDQILIPVLWNCLDTGKGPAEFVDRVQTLAPPNWLNGFGSGSHEISWMDTDPGPAELVDWIQIWLPRSWLTGYGSGPRRIGWLDPNLGPAELVDWIRIRPRRIGWLDPNPGPAELVGYRSGTRGIDWLDTELILFCYFLSYQFQKEQKNVPHSFKPYVEIVDTFQKLEKNLNLFLSVYQGPWQCYLKKEKEVKKARVSVPLATENFYAFIYPCEKNHSNLWWRSLTFVYLIYILTRIYSYFKFFKKTFQKTVSFFFYYKPSFGNLETPPCSLSNINLFIADYYLSKPSELI